MDENHYLTVKAENIRENDCWEKLKSYTDARIALGRTGCSILTNDYLAFSLAHAKARDSIKMPFDRDRIGKELRAMGLETINVESSAVNREIYLCRPDFGRRLSERSKLSLDELNYQGADVLLVIGDGLSSKAVHKQAVPFIRQFLPYMEELGMTVGPVVLAKESRVALGDDIAERMHCGLVATLIGERPGLSSPDSLGVYMTYKPYCGRMESERNCISNIRPEGLSYGKAAFKLAWLIENAYNMKKSGTALKDQSDDIQHYLTLKPHIKDSDMLNIV